MVCLWISFGFPVVFLWFSYGVPMVPVWFSDGARGFPIVSHSFLWPDKWPVGVLTRMGPYVVIAELKAWASAAPRPTFCKTAYRLVIA